MWLQKLLVKGQFCCPQFTTNLSVPFQNPLQTPSLHGGSLANSPGNYIHTLLLPGCRCHKIGTVIYRQGGDILYALAYSLGILNN